MGYQLVKYMDPAFLDLTVYQERPCVNSLPQCFIEWYLQSVQETYSGERLGWEWWLHRISYIQAWLACDLLLINQNIGPLVKITSQTQCQMLRDERWTFVFGVMGPISALPYIPECNFQTLLAVKEFNSVQLSCGYPEITSDCTGQTLSLLRLPSSLDSS